MNSPRVHWNPDDPDPNGWCDHAAQPADSAGVVLYDLMRGDDAGRSQPIGFVEISPPSADDTGERTAIETPKSGSGQRPLPEDAADSTVQMGKRPVD